MDAGAETPSQPDVRLPGRRWYASDDVIEDRSQPQRGQEGLQLERHHGDKHKR